MKNKKAFTLIELLVVVLIIGILAAIALPKYELAVEKSRLAEALTMVSSLQKAMDVYVLENGYPPFGVPRSFLGDRWDAKDSLAIDLSNLDCSLDNGQHCASKNFYYQANCTVQGCYVGVVRRNNSGYGMIFSKPSGGGVWHGGECAYSSDDPIGEKICKQMKAQDDSFELCPDC